MISTLPDLHQEPAELPLGRSIVEHDPKSRQYPLEAVLEAFLGPLDAMRAHWRRNPFDQNTGGSWNGHRPESSCTFQMAAGLLVTSPHRKDPHVRKQMAKLMDPAFRYEGYRLAQQMDPWEGEEPTYYGSSTLAAMKAAKALGLVPEGWEYRWSFNGIPEIRRALRLVPIGVGTNWYDGMDRPDRHGRVKVEGEIRGGHAWYLYDYDPEDGGWYDAWNSWGRWGRGGRFRIRESDLERLLAERGEAVAWVPQLPA